MRERLDTDYAWTPRQRDVLNLIVRGKTNPEIAEALGISSDGVKYHVSEILSKLGADSREEAAEYWRLHNGMSQRFSRVFRSTGLLGSLKWTVGAVAIGGVALAAGAILLSRGDDGDGGQASPETETPTSLVTPGTAGVDSTGDPRVDALIAAVESGDRALMETFVRTEDVPCDTETGGAAVNVPLCGSEPIGTLMPGFPLTTCEGPSWTRSQFPWIDSLQGRSPKVYAVFEQAPATSTPPVAGAKGDLLVLFQTGSDGGFALDVSAGQMLHGELPCGPFPYVFTGGVAASRFVLVPSGGIPVATPTPAPRLTGDAETDAIIRELVNGDIPAFSSRFALLPEPCAANPQGVGSPPRCPDGVPDGSFIQGARVAVCERAYLDVDWKFNAFFRPIFAYPQQLYAVFRTDGSLAFDWIPTGSLAIVVSDGSSGRVFYTDGGEITGAWMGCGTPASEMVKDVAAEAFLIPAP